jgi:hypothetical protein
MSVHKVVTLPMGEGEAKEKGATGHKRETKPESRAEKWQKSRKTGTKPTLYLESTT